MNKKLEKIELLNKQNELSLSRLDKPDKKNLYINYIKGKIKYEILDRVLIGDDIYYKIPLYNFSESFIPYIKVVSYFDTENGNYQYINEDNFYGDTSYIIRQIPGNKDVNHQIEIRVNAYLNDNSGNRLPLYNTLFLHIQLPQHYNE